MEETGGTKVDPFVSRIAKVRSILCPVAIISSYLFSLLILGAGIWLFCMKDYTCEDLLHMPRLRILMGVSMIIVFIASNTAVFYGSRYPLPSYMAVMLCLILIFMMGLAFVGAYKMESRSVPGSPMWLRERVNNNENWSAIKTCIFDTKICSELGYKSIALSSDEFNIKKLSPIEAGCCKPPISCGMEYINATFWNTNKNDKDDGDKDESMNPLSYFIGDCELWSNEENQLCYNCQSCKEGFLASLHHKWWRLGILIILIVAFLTLIHTIRFIAMMYETSSDS